MTFRENARCSPNWGVKWHQNYGTEGVVNNGPKGTQNTVFSIFSDKLFFVCVQKKHTCIYAKMLYQVALILYTAYIYHISHIMVSQITVPGTVLRVCHISYRTIPVPSRLQYQVPVCQVDAANVTHMRRSRCWCLSSNNFITNIYDKTIWYVDPWSHSPRPSTH